MSGTKPKKMSAKPPQTTPASLDAFISGADPVSSRQNTHPKTLEVGPSSQQSSTSKRPVGKPAMEREKVRSKTVQVKLTEEELHVVKNRAGKVPISTFLRDEMKSKGIL